MIDVGNIFGDRRVHFSAPDMIIIPWSDTVSKEHAGEVLEKVPWPAPSPSRVSRPEKQITSFPRGLRTSWHPAVLQFLRSSLRGGVVEEKTSHRDPPHICHVAEANRSKCGAPGGCWGTSRIPHAQRKTGNDCIQKTYWPFVTGWSPCLFQVWYSRTP